MREDESERGKRIYMEKEGVDVLEVIQPSVLFVYMYSVVINYHSLISYCPRPHSPPLTNAFHWRLLWPIENSAVGWRNWNYLRRGDSGMCVWGGGSVMIVGVGRGKGVVKEGYCKAGRKELYISVVSLVMGY